MLRAPCSSAGGNRLSANSAASSLQHLITNHAKGAKKKDAPGSSPQPGSRSASQRNRQGRPQYQHCFLSPYPLLCRAQPAKLLASLQSSAVVMTWLAHIVVFNFTTLVALQQDQNYLTEKRRMLF